MFAPWLFFFCVIDAKIIKNINVPSCVNCKYYKPLPYKNFHSEYNECTYFGTKNIQTGLIEYDTVISCRKDDSKCGINATYFEENNFATTKMILHSVRNPNSIIVVLLVCIAIAQIYAKND
jgi:hypothetical protein